MDFETALASWLEKAQEVINENYRKNFPRLNVPQLVLERGRRYIRVVRHLEVNGQRVDHSAHAFIDSNGDVLKPASYKAPAKHARGNIFDDANGMRYVSAYGPAYIRSRG
jgi:hypothetical protein